MVRTDNRYDGTDAGVNDSYTKGETFSHNRTFGRDPADCYMTRAEVSQGSSLSQKIDKGEGDRYQVTARDDVPESCCQKVGNCFRNLFT
jgi:hypothetical protein